MARLEANQPVHLMINQRAVASRVIRCVRQEVYIDALRDNEMELTPLPGTRIPIRWVEDETLYEQMGQVHDVLDPIPIVVVHLQGEPVVVEQRQSLRVKVGVPLEYGLVRPGADMLVTTTIDLSATGLKFPSAVRVWPGLELRMRLRVDGREFEMISRVIRVANQPREIRGRKSWETAVQFIRFTPEAHRHIMGFIRRQHHKKNLGKL